MNRIIKFFGWANFLINDNKPFEEQVEFEWDGKSDVMKPAFEALEVAMSRYTELTDYSVSDWTWIN